MLLLSFFFNQFFFHENYFFFMFRDGPGCSGMFRHVPESGGVRTTTAMHCGFKIFKMEAKVEKFRRLYALFFNRYSYFLRSFFSIS